MTARELDAMVAEKVMGREVIKRPYSDEGPCLRAVDSRQWVPMPFYSTDIGSAWEVVEKMADKGFYASIQNCHTPISDWCVVLANGKDAFEAEGAFPRAACLAALRAVGVEL